MRKFLSLISILFTLICFSCVSYAFDYEGMYENSQAVYVPDTNSWTYDTTIEGGIALTKKISEEDNNNSEYFLQNGQKAFSLDSQFEFIKDGKFISVDNKDLKYNEIIINNNTFQLNPLSYEEIQALFPNVDVIKVSDFKYGMKIVKKGLGEKTILLYNDTSNSYEGYIYKPAYVKTVAINGLITLRHPIRVTFYNPEYTAVKDIAKIARKASKNIREAKKANKPEKVKTVKVKKVKVKRVKNNNDIEDIQNIDAVEVTAEAEEISPENIQYDAEEITSESEIVEDYGNIPAQNEPIIIRAKW